MIIKNEIISNEIIESSFCIFVNVTFDYDFCFNLSFDRCSFIDCKIDICGQVSNLKDYENFTGKLLDIQRS